MKRRILVSVSHEREKGGEEMKIRDDETRQTRTEIGGRQTRNEANKSFTSLLDVVLHDSPLFS
jgi:hypothetical protein